MTITNDTAMSRPEKIRFARFGFTDMIQGLVRWRLWAPLAWMDVRQRYRRSILGPFWITLSLGIMVLGLGIVYGALLHQELHDYMPYLATGLIVWGLISTMLTESFLRLHRGPTTRSSKYHFRSALSYTGRSRAT